MYYRKKPVVIEAHWLGHHEQSAKAMAEWCGGTFYERFLFGKHQCWVVEIATLEGTMEATSGDMVIRGVQGEFYPCKRDIFTATYEPA